jgi:hypothetical protein
MIPIRPSLRVRRELTHAASAVIAAVVEATRLDLIDKGWTPERAAWWAGRVGAVPELRWDRATRGLDEGEAR